MKWHENLYCCLGQRLWYCRRCRHKHRIKWGREALVKCSVLKGAWLALTVIQS